MLTSADIENKRFEKAAFGYKAEEVDTFLTDLSITLNQLYAQNQELEDKLVVLADKLEEYRANEDSLRTVLIGAQKLGDSIIRDSKGKAEVILSEANERARQITSEVERKIDSERETYSRIRRETADFKKRLLAVYRQHLELISALPEEEKPEQPAPEKEEPEVPVQPVEETAVEGPASAEAEAEAALEYDEIAMAETKEIKIPQKD